MTRQERAKLNRIEKRRHDLFTSLCIIVTWIGVCREDETADDLLFRISKFCTEKIENEKYAQAKKEKSNE